MLDGAPVGISGPRSWAISGTRTRCAACGGCTSRPGGRNRHLLALLHDHSASVLVAGSLLLHGKTVRKMLPWVERLTYRSRKLPASFPAAAAQED